MPPLTNRYPKLDHPDISAVLFHPRPERPPQVPGVVPHTFRMEDGARIGARLHLAAPDTPTILFFHGNGEVAADYDDIGPGFVAQGVSFWVIDYRGYGESDGMPSASAMMADAHGVFQQTRNWLSSQGRGGPLFLMGRSLGSAPAIELAAAAPDAIAGLIIDSGFGTTTPLLVTLGIQPSTYGITEADGFQNLQKIARISKPTTILHGQFDDLIPPADAEMLQVQSAAHVKEFHLIPGADHNTIFAVTGDLYFQAIRQFMNKILKVRPRRYQSRRNPAAAASD